jgi:hypothetical protein
MIIEHMEHDEIKERDSGLALVGPWGQDIDPRVMLIQPVHRNYLRRYLILKRAMLKRTFNKSPRCSM